MSRVAASRGWKLLIPLRVPFQIRTSVTDPAVRSDHTAKWMQEHYKKSPMELIAVVPPIEVKGRIAVCEGAKDPALGHPVEYINVDDPRPNVCKYCGLRYVQEAHHHHSH